MPLRLNQLDTAWLKRVYLHGIPLTDEKGVPLAEDAIQFYIDGSIAQVEGSLDLAIRARESIVERHDFHIDRWRKWGFLQLHRRPITQVRRVQVMFGNTGVFDMPVDSWIRVSPPANKYGQIQVFPSLGTFASVPALDQAYVLAPILMSVHYAPQIFEVTYDAGMAEVEEDMADAIGMLAAIQIFNVMGEIVFGAGIAGFSMGLDGLSQSVSTTMSAENSAYAARIIMYGRRLYGWQGGEPGLMHHLKKKWLLPLVTTLP